MDYRGLELEVHQMGQSCFQTTAFYEGYGPDCSSKDET